MGRRKNNHPKDRGLQQKIQVIFRRPDGATPDECEEKLKESAKRIERELRDTFKSSNKEQAARVKYRLFFPKNLQHVTCSCEIKEDKN